MTSTGKMVEKPPNFDNMSPEEKKMFEKYGRLPNQSKLLEKKEKKFFDSADYNLNKAKGHNEPHHVQQPSEKTIKE
eukprot:gene16179-19257_t